MMTIATFSTPDEAHLFRMKLGAAGIEAYVVDENMVQAYWLYSNAIGGVRVQIDEADLPAVKEFLSQETEIEAAADGEIEALNCPECGSTAIEADDTSRRVALFVVSLTAIPLPFSKDTWHCTACNHKWKTTATDDDEKKNPAESSEV